MLGCRDGLTGGARGRNFLLIPAEDPVRSWASPKPKHLTNPSRRLGVCVNPSVSPQNPRVNFAIPAQRPTNNVVQTPQPENKNAAGTSLPVRAFVSRALDNPRVALQGADRSHTRNPGSNRIAPKMRVAEGGGSPCWMDARQTKPPTQPPGGPCGLEACHRTSGFRSPDAQRAVVHVARWRLGTGDAGRALGAREGGLMVRRLDYGVVGKRLGDYPEWLDCLSLVCRWRLSQHHPCLFDWTCHAFTVGDGGVRRCR
ncbi:hypothetical protein B0T11DRAFT_72817 [Plectosphaerella cucumerina]|uniref:Uncharacterized protein n=1 Tax=Plectosphaerella cucumerina TaxID=40658 RepID=A0A8K0X8U2_9PEZI|nr:hypothetical protein B0T11DRAFT_72817 [Plectosphaerella cucumerina]